MIIECFGQSCDRLKSDCTKHDCDENAFCSVNPFVKDGYECNCLDGFEGNGKTCRYPCKPEGRLQDDHYKVIVDDNQADVIDLVCCVGYCVGFLNNIPLGIRKIFVSTTWRYMGSCFHQLAS